MASRYGPPPHKEQQGELEFWHYPLGVVGTMVYSIHLAVVEDQPSQVYLHMEPASEASSAPKRPWWRFW